MQIFMIAYLYTLIDFDALYRDVFKDFTLVFFPMISEMKDAGKEIWYPSDEDLNMCFLYCSILVKLFET